MAKSGKKSGKGGKLPKRIAGFKVPKALRKQKGVAALLRHPVAAEIALSAVIAGAAALKHSRAARPAAAPSRSPADTVSELAESLGAIGNSVAAKLREAVASIEEKIVTSTPAAERVVDVTPEPEPEPAPPPPTRPVRRSRATNGPRAAAKPAS